MHTLAHTVIYSLGGGVKCYLLDNMTFESTDECDVQHNQAGENSAQKRA